MKSFARFIVQSPANAALIAALAIASILLAWVGVAVAALYTLRFGFSAARTVVLAALVPSTYWAYQGAIDSLIMLIGTLVLALLLRYRARWSELVIALPFVFMAMAVATLMLVPDYVQWLENAVAIVVEQFKVQALSNPNLDAQSAKLLEAMSAPDAVSLMGMVVIFQASTALISLLLARWWQSLLYNPGGFADEFRQLRLSRLQIILAISGFVLLAHVGLGIWGWACLLPMIIAGIAMVHGLVAIAEMPARWLVGFYALLLLFNPAVLLLIVLAVIDSAVDFRRLVRQRT